MSRWHADIDRSSLVAGTSLTVFSPHQAGRVIAADQLSIETPAGDRIGAQVLDRSAGNLTLVLPSGQVARLSILTDDSIVDHWQPGDMFSQQRWIVN